RKSTIEGCQFLRKRLISWQCKKQTIVANSTTEAEYVAASNLPMNSRKILLVVLVKVTQVLFVDGKKVIITEASIRHDLKLKDVKGTECLPNNTIFEELERMSVKTTAGNEFSRTMASAIICLATNQKFNFSKYIFDNMVENLEVGVKFFMFPREGKGFSGVVTPLFETTMVQAPKEGRSITDIDQDKGTTFVDDTQGKMNEEDMFEVNDLDGDKVVVDVLVGEKEEQSEKVTEKEVSNVDPITTSREVVSTTDVKVSVSLTTTTTTDDELNLAQTLIEIKDAKPKTITTVATTVIVISIRPKEKGIIMQEAKTVEPKRPLKRKEQIMMDEQIAKDLEAKMKGALKQEQMIAKQKEEEANIDLIAK
nr:putative ribonuclease H-like domain-containing protein [Tanacetum cinerariifolium]